MKTLIDTFDSFDKLFWLEKGINFVKLCSCFSPEIDESFDNTQKFINSKLAEKIDLTKYHIFSATEIDRKLSFSHIEDKDLLAEFFNVLMPKDSSLSSSDLENIFKQNRVKPSDSYKVFYFKQFAEIQNQIPNSILIAQNVFIQSKEFVSCPKNSYNLVIYSVDIYGDAVQNIDWDIKQK